MKYRHLTEGDAEGEDGIEITTTSSRENVQQQHEQQQIRVEEQQLEDNDEPADLNKAAGCVVNPEDYPSVIISFSCFALFIIYGAASASLGPAIPFLASHYHKSINEIGITFTSRGIGYLLGTLLSVPLLSPKISQRVPFFTKEMIAALSEILMGSALFLVTFMEDFLFCLILFFFQGIAYGIICTVGNCILPELWGRRVGPWMQALHSCFGIGAIIGPSLIASSGYQICFLMVFLGSFIPFGIILVANFWLTKRKSTTFTYPSSHSSSSSSSPSSASSHLPHHHSQTSHSPLHSTSPTTASTTTDSTLSHAPSPIIPGRPTPLLHRLVLTAFFYTYVGIETGFAGWIPSYALEKHVTTSESQAAYLSAIFWLALTLGRLCGIPLAIFLPATFMIRIQLSFAIIFGIFCITILTLSYPIASFVSGWAGFAMAAIFPVMITIIGDYGYRLDASSTAYFMIGATLGESTAPVIIGFLMLFGGLIMFPISIFFCTLALSGYYLLFHFLYQKDEKNRRVFKHERLEMNSEHPFGDGEGEYNPMAVRESSFTIQGESDEEEEEEGQGDEEDIEEGKEITEVDERGIEQINYKT